MIGLNSQACRENFTFPFSLSSRKLQAEAANDFEGDKFHAFHSEPTTNEIGWEIGCFERITTKCWCGVNSGQRWEVRTGTKGKKGKKMIIIIIQRARAPYHYLYYLSLTLFCSVSLSIVYHTQSFDSMAMLIGWLARWGQPTHTHFILCWTDTLFPFPFHSFCLSFIISNHVTAPTGMNATWDYGNCSKKVKTSSSSH